MDVRTVTPVIGLVGPAGAPRPELGSDMSAYHMATCTGWLGLGDKQRGTRPFATANHSSRRLREVSP